VFFLCCALCRARRSKGPTLVHTLVQPVFLLSNHYANTKAGTQVATPAKLVPTLDMAHKLQHLQNSCQLWTWHRCCNTSKTRANSAP